MPEMALRYITTVDVSWKRLVAVDNWDLEPHTGALSHPVAGVGPFFYVGHLHTCLLFHCSDSENMAVVL
jgi:hypothetical protein